MDDLGFGRWSEDNPMRLIPLWLYKFLPDEIESESISGKSVRKTADMDNDSRYGCLAYGICPTKPTQTNMKYAITRHDGAIFPVRYETMADAQAELNKLGNGGGYGLVWIIKITENQTKPNQYESSLFASAPELLHS